MTEATNTSSQSETSTNGPVPLVRHTKKQEWGRALLLWRREEKRAYQFEDGNMRVFAERFCDFFQPARQPDPVLRELLRERAVADGHMLTDGSKGKGKAVANLGPTPTVADQIVVFNNLFEGGFLGTQWRDACRAREKGKALKRHLDPVLESAQKQLDQAVLREHIENGNPTLVVSTILELVGKTTMATSKQLEVFRSLEVDDTLALAFVDFLYDVPAAKGGALNQLRLALAKQDLKKVPWTVLTAARALVHPETHVFVRPSAFRDQAKLLMPGFTLTTVPKPDAYARCLEMAIGIRSSLREAGMQPRDLFDVAEFMRVTLSKSNRDELLGAMTERMRPKASGGPAVH